MAIAKPRLLGALSLVTGGLVLLSACGDTPTPSPQGLTPTSSPTGTANEVKIGFVFATSGDNAVYGASQKAAAQMAIDEINAAGKGPELIPLFEDTAGEPNKAATIFQELINTDKVGAIIGPTLSSEAAASDPEAQKDKVPVLAVSNTASGITDMGDYIFRDSLAESQVIPETVKEAKAKLNLARVDLIYANDDAFSKSGADVFRTELQKEDIRIVNEKTFSTNDTDFKELLESAKGDDPDAIVISALARPAQLILQQARSDVGIDPRVAIIGGNGFNSPAVVAAAGPAAEGLIVGAAWNPNVTDDLNKKFITDFNRINGKEPDQFAAQAYAGVYILDDAIVRAKLSGKSLADARTAIRDALKDTKDLQTVLGSFSFTDKRDASHTPVVQIVKDGKFAIFQ